MIKFDTYVCRVIYFKTRSYLKLFWKFKVTADRKIYQKKKITKNSLQITRKHDYTTFSDRTLTRTSVHFAKFGRSRTFCNQNCTVVLILIYLFKT